MFIPRLIDGRMKCVEAEPTVWNGGYGYDSRGSLCIFYGAPPDGGIAGGGPLRTNSGRVCVSTNAIAGAAGGVPVDSAGRMVVSDMGVPDEGAAGLPMAANGKVLVDGSSFFLPLNDLGNGEVSLALWQGTGSGTFTRATIASCRLSDGTLKKVASGVPRSHYLSSLAYAGYLAEGARTNICLESEALDDATGGWNAPSRATISANAIAAPDGTTTADKVVEDSTASNTHFASQNITYTAAVHTFSCFVKAGERTWCRLLVFDGTTTFAAYFNLSTGAVGTLTSATATIEAWGNGWYRCAVTTNANTAAAAGRIDCRLASADNTDSYNGDGASGAYFWGAQVEAGSFASSYIPTTTASVTRNADVLTYTFAGNASATAGWCYAELWTEWATAGTNSIAVGTAGSTEGALLVTAGSAATVMRARDGTNAPTKSGLTDMSTGIRKRASTWGSALNVTGDGAAVATSAFDGSIGSTGVGIGTRGDGAGSSEWFGTLKNVRLGTRALADAQIVAATS